jgi:hypothetical protein
VSLKLKRNGNPLPNICGLPERNRAAAIAQPRAATVEEIDRSWCGQPTTEAAMQNLSHIHLRPAKALVLVASVAALVASPALGASYVVASHRGDRGYLTGEHGAPPAVAPATATPGSYTVSPVGPAAPTPSVTIVEPSAFDWANAGVGAAGAFGLILLSGGIAIASRHRRRAA